MREGLAMKKGGWDKDWEKITREEKLGGVKGKTRVLSEWYEPGIEQEKERMLAGQKRR